MLLWLALFLSNQSDRTTFQTSQPYRPSIAIPADAAIVYGFGNNMPARVKSWKDQGYTVQLMTGVAWGQYQDYLYGRFDGKNHEDEAQTDKNGNKISHGGDVYYMSPGPSYGNYLAAGVRKALDVGVDSIYLEEPEFWVRAGYSPAFKREWQGFYHEPWQAPDSSPEAQWRASKLKYFLYRRALQQVFDDVQLYNKEHARNVQCYVATHSLLNYSSWNIVSPESSLAQLKGCDGYIAQVWTGTARTPNYYNGELKERTFETAFLEYGALANVASATGKRLWLLADPVEDDPKHDWADYKRNYEATLTASLLQPETTGYEVMPWPERVFEGQYPVPGNPAIKMAIPTPYATELQLVDFALSRIAATKNKQVMAGLPGIGFVVSDSLMFERAGPSPSDPQLSHIYGLALPFVDNGVPIQPVQLETTTPQFLAHYKLLLMTYRGMKPMTPQADQHIADWVRAGGALIFVDDDGDPFNHIREWWNSDGRKFETPRQALFQELAIVNEGYTKCGKGLVYWIRKDPSSFAKTKGGAQELLNCATSCLLLKDIHLHFPGGLFAKLGPYAAIFSPHFALSIIPDIPVVDLFDPELRIQKLDSLDGPCHLLVCLDEKPGPTQLLALAGKCISQTLSTNGLALNIRGIEGTKGVALLRMPSHPSAVTLNGETITDNTYDPNHNLLWVRFANSATPRTLEVKL